VLKGLAGSSSLAMGGLAASVAVVGLAVGKFTSITIPLVMEMEKMQNMLIANTGSILAAKQQYNELAIVANKFGLGIRESVPSFARFAAATKDTALEGKGTMDIFKGLGTASIAMGLSAEQSGRALTALQQMMSKGTVQAEELRGQLGEHIPGAFNLAAKAMGVTTRELGKMMENGEVMAVDLLPRLAAEMQRTFGAAAEENQNSLAASMTRMQNNLFEFGAGLGKVTGIAELFKDAIVEINDVLENMNNIMGSRALSNLNPGEITEQRLRGQKDEALAEIKARMYEVVNKEEPRGMALAKETERLQGSGRVEAYARMLDFATEAYRNANEAYRVIALTNKILDERSGIYEKQSAELKFQSSMEEAIKRGVKNETGVDKLLSRYDPLDNLRQDLDKMMKSYQDMPAKFDGWDSIIRMQTKEVDTFMGSFDVEEWRKKLGLLATLPNLAPEVLAHFRGEFGKEMGKARAKQDKDLAKFSSSSAERVPQGWRPLTDTRDMIRDAYGSSAFDKIDNQRQGQDTMARYQAQLQEIDLLRLSADTQHEYNIKVQEARDIVVSEISGLRMKAGVIQELLTPMELYNERMEKWKELLDGGLISQEQYNRGAEKFRDTLISTEPILQYLGNGFDSFADGIADAMARSGDSMLDFRQVASNVLRELYSDMIKFAIMTPIKNALFGGLTSLFSFGAGFFGGGSSVGGSLGAGNTTGAGGAGFSYLGYGGPRAGGGSVSPGMFYKVGEEGEEIFAPKTAGTIIPADVSREMMQPRQQQSAPGNTYIIDARGADQAAIARLESSLRELAGPGKVEKRAVAAVIEARRKQPKIFGVAKP